MDPYKLAAFTTFGQFNNFQPHPYLRGSFLAIPTKIVYHEPYSEDTTFKGSEIVNRTGSGDGGEPIGPSVTSGITKPSPRGVNAAGISTRSRYGRRPRGTSKNDYSNKLLYRKDGGARRRQAQGTSDIRLS